MSVIWWWWNTWYFLLLEPCLHLDLLLTTTTVRLPSTSKPCTQTTAAMLGRNKATLKISNSLKVRTQNAPGANSLQNKSSGNVRGHGNSGTFFPWPPCWFFLNHWVFLILLLGFLEYFCVGFLFCFILFVACMVIILTPFAPHLFSKFTASSSKQMYPRLKFGSPSSWWRVNLHRSMFDCKPLHS